MKILNTWSSMGGGLIWETETARDGTACDRLARNKDRLWALVHFLFP